MPYLPRRQNRARTRSHTQKLGVFCGKTAFNPFFHKFESVAEHNELTERSKLIMLVQSLVGKALPFFTTLPSEEKEATKLW